jgi:omega-amidase
MRVACCQLDIVWEDKPANYRKVRSLLAQAQLPADTLVVLPEMFATGFSMNVAVTREEAPFPTESFLAKMACDLHLSVIGGFAGAGQDGQARNQAAVFSPTGQRLGRYSKMHPFSLGGEAQHYAAGTEIVAFEWQGCQVAPFICYDLRFPELFRAAVRRGVALFVVIANWPSRRIDHWITLLQARAIENQAYVVGVNRCGADPKHSYTGRSLVVDHHGVIRLDLGYSERVESIDLDLAAVEAWRKEFPALRDMQEATWSDRRGTIKKPGKPQEDESTPSPPNS